MNILEKMLLQMEETRLLDLQVIKMMRDTGFCLTFHVHYQPHRLTIHDSSRQLMCVMDGEKLVPMDVESPSKEMLDVLEYINKEVSKL